MYELCMNQHGPNRYNSCRPSFGNNAEPVYYNPLPNISGGRKNNPPRIEGREFFSAIRITMFVQWFSPSRFFTTFNPSEAMRHVAQLTKPLALVLILAMTTATTSCTSMSGAGQGAGIGAASGAVIGGLIGSASGNWGRGALIGAVIGGAAGALIGDYMDAQAEEIDEQVDGATVERVGEGIRVVFDTGLLFTTGSSTLTSTSRDNIEQLAIILNKYEDTNIVIEGHTDSIDSDYNNQVLSEKRAESVASLLRAYGVSSGRISTVGYGETRPVASNATAAGRKLNRRVEVLIYANDDLIDQAETGELRM